MATDAERQAYAAAMSELVQSSVAARSGAADGAAEFLRDAIARINGDLSRIPIESWTFGRLQELRRAVAEAAIDMRADLDARARAAVLEALQQGSDAALAPLLRQGILEPRVIQAFPFIDPGLVNTLTGFTSRLITNLADETSDAIAREIALSLISGQGREQTVTNIATALDSPSVFGSLIERARVIERTESLRALSIAQEVRGVELVRIFTGMEKQWLAFLDERVRESHANAHLQTVAMQLPFTLEDPKRGTVTLMFPRDPSAPGWATILCRCAYVFLLPTIRLSDLPGDASAQVATIRNAVAGMAAEE